MSSHLGYEVCTFNHMLLNSAQKIYETHFKITLLKMTVMLKNSEGIGLSHNSIVDLISNISSKSMV